MGVGFIRSEPRGGGKLGALLPGRGVGLRPAPAGGQRPSPPLPGGPEAAPSLSDTGTLSDVGGTGGGKYTSPAEHSGLSGPFGVPNSGSRGI